MRHWRTLLRVERQNHPWDFYAIIPAWNTGLAVRIPFDGIPYETVNRIRDGQVYFHVHARTAAKTAHELDLREWENE